MRWQPKSFLVFFLIIFGLLCLYGSDRLPFRSRGMRYERYIPPDKIKFIKLSESAQVVFGVRDNRDGNMGRPSARFLVIATRKLRFHCRFPSGIEVVAKSYEFSENHNMLFGIYYVNCEIPVGEYPFKAVDVSEESEAKWVSVPITYTIEDERKYFNYEFDYGLCVPVLFGAKYSAKNFIEFMELNTLLGVQRVTVYTDGNPIERKLSKVLNYYSHMGLLQVVLFTLPSNFTKIWYHGQLAVITDCLVRHTAKARYVGFHDLDEYLIPTQESNMQTVLKQKLTDKVGSLRVPTQYMSSSTRQTGDLITLVAFEHGPNPDRMFTKCVLRPEMVFEQGIHHTSRVIQDDYTSPHAEVSDLLLYHYKNQGVGKTTTRIADIYGPQLLENYAQVVKYLGI